jgi:hypothetical protein
MKTNLAPFPLQEELRTRIQMAAIGRASGMSWKAVSEEIGRSARSCRSWPRMYPDLWMQFVRQAQVEVLANLSISAVRMLKKSLRSKNERTQLNTAKFLYSSDLKIRLAEIKVQSKEPDIVEQIKELSQEEAEQHFDRIVNLRLASQTVPEGEGANVIVEVSTNPSIDESQ